MHQRDLKEGFGDLWLPHALARKYPRAGREWGLRGQRVMIDADLAELYGVATKRLNEQVKRNPRRFPVEFVFQLNEKERAEVVAKCDHLSRLRFSMREALGMRRELAKRLDDLERKVGTHDRAIAEILQAIRQLATPPSTAMRRIGFL